MNEEEKKIKISANKTTEKEEKNNYKFCTCSEYIEPKEGKKHVLPSVYTYKI